MVKILIIAIVFMAWWIIELYSKVHRLKKQILRSDLIIKNHLAEKEEDKFAFNEYRRLVQKYAWACTSNDGNNGQWEIIDIGNRYMVAKRDQTGEIAVIARTYPYNRQDNDDMVYAHNCAEELLDKLTEKI